MKQFIAISLNLVGFSNILSGIISLKAGIDSVYDIIIAYEEVILFELYFLLLIII